MPALPPSDATTDTDRLTIVVHAQVFDASLSRSLRSLAALHDAALEVLLVTPQGASGDLPQAADLLQRPGVAHLQVPADSSQGAGLNAGLAAARGRWITFLMPGDELPTQQVSMAKARFKAEGHDGPALALCSGQPTWPDLVRVGQALTPLELLFDDGFAQGTAFFDTATLRTLGGVDETLAAWAQADLLIRVAHTGPVVWLPQTRLAGLDIGNPTTDRSERLALMHKHVGQLAPAALADWQQRVLTQRRDDRMQLAASAERQQALDRDVDRLQVEHRAQLHARDAELAQLRATLVAQQSSLGWRLIQWQRGLREQALPRGTRRRRLLDLALHAGLVVRHEGVIALCRKVGRKLNAIAQRATQLVCATWRFYRREGLAVTLARIRNRLRDGTASTPTPAALAARTEARYAAWIGQHETHDVEAQRRAVPGLKLQPTISIVTPVYNVDPQWLDRCVQSVLAQTYPNWQLCLQDDASTREDTRRALLRWQGQDPRIHVGLSAHNGGISAASNAALAVATGEFIALLDHDDELSVDALFEVASLLNEHPDTDLVYSDEDRITVGADGVTVRHDPFFKTDWSPQLLFACMYTGHLSVYRSSLVRELGGFRSEYDFSQDYDLALRVTEKTPRIRHLPKVLYHWRTLPESAAGGGKGFARRTNIAALQAACDRRGYNAQAVALPHCNRVLFHPAPTPPLVSIIIPTDSRQNVFNCIQLLLAHTDYTAFEVLVVTNTGLAQDVDVRYSGDGRVRTVRFDRPFNFSLKCNVGAAAARGEYVLFYNDDVEAIDGSWLQDMVGVFGRGGVGGVSPKLFYENDTIQYAGMITGVRGLVGTAFHTYPKDSGAYFNMVQSERDVALLSGACLLMPKAVFDAIGGFDAERTPIMHSDVDLCCRIHAQGLAMVYTPHAALRHIGHLSLKDSDHEPERRKDKADLYVLKRWGEHLSRDPFHPENMTALLYHQGHVPYRVWARQQPDALIAAKDLLLVSHDLSLSGAPILLVGLAELFRARGHFVTVMSPQDGELSARLRERNIPLIIDATLETTPDPQTVKLMAAFDLVLANTIVAWPTVLAAKASGTPVLWMLHESHDGVRHAREEPHILQALQQADDVVFACEATRALYEPLRKADNFRVVPYGAAALQAPQSPSESPDRVRVLHVGSVERRKGQDVLLAALARLPASSSDRLDVVMIGRPLKPDFVASIQPALQACTCVRYLGQLPHAQIGAHVAAADVFVSSSRDEVFPVTIMEAMSAGKPVIATAVGGVPEMLRHGVDGLVIAPEDSAALARALISLIDDAPARQRMGASARSRFQAHYTLDKLAARLLALIEPRL